MDGEWAGKTTWVPGGYALYPAYPNPFNPSTTIQYEIVEKADMRISIYNILGKEVKSLFNGVQDPGTWVVKWDEDDQTGKVGSPGIYFCRLEVGYTVLNRKMIFLK
ncbi:MAG: T9SS type A sorting domain-containing protein [Candidatus Marinimicrobia bacterium]|nr:T9SS type A sorting domain-containing protein [Candidatus Neomarinimicrobiota bacterium]